MGRTDQSHIHRLLDGRADLAHPPLLDCAQQLDLHGKRQVGHLVEHQRAAVGCLKETVAVFGGAGEGALAIAEELGFHQRFRNGAAVDRDKGLVGASALGMNVARGQFLAAA